MGGATFLARGQVELFDGWRRILVSDVEEETDQPTDARPRVGDDDDRGEAGTLPPLAVGDQLEVLGVEITTHTTNPRPLFTQASIVAELKRLGIGRPSTYHTVVPLLLGRGWATEEAPAATSTKTGAKNKADNLAVLVPSQVGYDLCDFLCEAFPGLVDYDFTANMEAALDQIEAGKRARLDVATTWWSRFERDLAVAITIKPRLRERKDLGPCPKCGDEGRTGHLRLIQGLNVATKKPYEFAGCDADTKEVPVCGHKAQVHDGHLVPASRCPQCQLPLRAVNRKDGGHSWKCEQHGWFLAGRTWQLVNPPPCPRCTTPMIHRERHDPKGEFFWACFADRVFVDSDRFGAASKPGKRSRRT